MLAAAQAQATRRALFGKLGLLHDGIAVGIDRHDEFDRPAADRTVLDEALRAPAGRIYADVVRLGAAGADVGCVRFKGHARGYSTAAARKHVARGAVPYAFATMRSTSTVSLGTSYSRPTIEP